MEQLLVSGFVCTTCGATVDISHPLSWRCPNSTATDRHHALQIVQGIAPLRGGPEANPFLAFRRYLAWDAYAASLGVGDAARVALVGELDSRIGDVAGTGFVATPFERADALSDELGFSEDGGVWVKDETGNVAGSHKARHLFTILLHLVTTERAGLAPWGGEGGRPPLAIASCGNAALAAATLAGALSWPIEVFVPPSADPHVTNELRRLGARVRECPRLASDPAGDPCVHRFHEAVAAGAIPFSVQGPENVWCLDGGRTIGWEMATHFEHHVDGPPLDRVYVQVGGGALAACTAAGFRMSGLMPALHAVQTESCAPLARAWSLAGGSVAVAGRWSELMWPWEHVGVSAADGILDDETYDWIPVVAGMAGGGGSPLVVSEALVLAANELARRTTTISASATGTAGLAGLLAHRDELRADERVAVIFSGVHR